MKQFSLTGQLPSGKNQVQLLFRKGKVMKYPNKTFAKWRMDAGTQLLLQGVPYVPIATPVRLICDYWPGDMRIRDVSGQLDAIFHLLVYCKVLKDDGFVYEVIWRRHDVNTRFPKAVLEIGEWP